MTVSITKFVPQIKILVHIFSQTSQMFENAAASIIRQDITKEELYQTNH